MRPIRLELSAFGPYLERTVIDFEKLNEAGLFLITGQTGGGKTTLCNLIPRFYDVTGGTIRIDGQDVRSVTLHSLRSAIGVVQQTCIFSAAQWRRISPTAVRARPAPKLRKLPAWLGLTPLSAP